MSPRMLRKVEDLRSVKGISFPSEVSFRQLIVTGPPGSGKTTQIRQIGGWPEEGYLDLTDRWWRAKALAFRPREVHLGFPFRGHPKALALFEPEWLEVDEPWELELNRIRIPPRRSLMGNPRKKYVFEFLIPHAQAVLEARRARAYRQSHHIDVELSLEKIGEQLDIHMAVARYLRLSGVIVYIRDEFGGPPKAFVKKSKAARRDDWARRVERALEDRIGSSDKDNQDLPLTPGIQEEVQLHERGAVVKREYLPVEITLGPQRIRIQPEPFLVRPTRANARNVVLMDPDMYNSSSGAFVRLGEGERIRIGKDKRTRFLVSRLTAEAPQPIEVTNERHRLRLIDVDPTAPATVRILNEPSDTQQLIQDRESSFLRILDAYGGVFRAREPEEALGCLQRVNLALEHSPFRATDSHGLPGGLVELPTDVTPVIVGDLHTNLDNLLTVLTSGRHLDRVEQGQGVIVLLGDAVHLDEGPDLAAMDDSVLMMDVVHCLMVTFPGRFIYMRGNHDSFSHDVRKGGVAQGSAWRNRLEELRGPDYIREMLRFYDLLPHVAMSSDFVAFHAGPPRGTVSRERIIEIRDRPRLGNELTWNRLRTATNPAGYSKRDVKALRKALGLKKSAPIIVSHNPQPDDETVWLNVGGVKNHHVVYSARSEEVGAFTRAGGRMVPLVYPSEALVARAAEVHG